MRVCAVLLLLTFVSCSSGDRTPATLITRYEMDLYDLLADMDEYLDLPSKKVCEGSLLEEKYQELYNATDKNIIIEKISNDAKRELIQKSFDVRLKQRKHLEYINATYTSWNKNCYEITRDISRALRYLEDVLIERLYVANDSKKFTTLEGEQGDYFLVNPNFTFEDHKNLKSGDIILSRGNAFSAAAISRIGMTDAQFSHLSFVYKDSKDKLHTTEAHIEIGNVARPFETHIEQKNGRTVVFRYKGKHRTAHVASHKSYHEVAKAEKEGRLIRYDFGMDLSDSRELFCSEVASYGFKDQGIDIPRIKTKFPKSLVPFLRKVGVKVNRRNISRFETFSPGDLEFDSRFELIAEWRDPRKLKALRHRDAILYKIFEWMENDRYEFKPEPGTQTTSFLAYLARRTWLKKNFFGKDLTKEFPLNMEPAQMNVFVVLNDVGEKMENRLKKVEKRQKKTLSFKESLEELEKYRKEEIAKYRDPFKKTDWYRLFRPGFF